MVRGWEEDMGRTGSHGIHVPWGPSIWGQCRGSSLVLRKPLTPESQGCGSFYSHVCHVTQEVYRLFMSPKPLCNMAPDAGTLVVTEWFHSSCRERLLWFMPSAFLDALRRNPIASGENRAHRCPDSYSLAFPRTKPILWVLLAPAACCDSSVPSSPQSAGGPHLGHQQSAGLGPRPRKEPEGSRCSGPLLRRPE